MAVDAIVTDVTSLGSRPLGIINVSVAFLTLTWTAVTLRVFVRVNLIHSFGWDDWTMLLTLALFTGQCACLIAVGRIEMGGPLKQAASSGPLGLFAELPIIEQLTGIIVVVMGLYLWVTVILKISLAIFFLRVITKPWHRKVVYTTSVIYTIYGVTFAFIGIFHCGNPKDYLLNELRGKCLSDGMLQPMNYIAAGFNALTDWIYVWFPLQLVWKAPMPRNAKISAGVLLVMGALGSISSLIRIAYIPGIKTGPHFFSQAVDIGVWSVIEPGIGIVAASLATLRPLFKCAQDTSRNIKSLGSSLKGGSSNRKSRTSMGHKIPASSALDFQDRSPGPYQVIDPESGISFEMTNTRSGKRLTELQELGYDLDKLTMLGEEWQLPSPKPIPSMTLQSTPSNDRGRRPVERFEPHMGSQAPSRAFVEHGKVVVIRP